MGERATTTPRNGLGLLTHRVLGPSAGDWAYGRPGSRDSALQFAVIGTDGVNVALRQKWQGSIQELFQDNVGNERPHLIQALPDVRPYVNLGSNSILEPALAGKGKALDRSRSRAFLTSRLVEEMEVYGLELCARIPPCGVSASRCSPFSTSGSAGATVARPPRLPVSGSVK